MKIQSEIEQFIIEDLLSGSRTAVDPDEPLYGSGNLDSLGTLRLINFLEEHYGLQIGDGEVGDENFGSLSKLAAFVEQKLARSRQ